MELKVKLSTLLLFVILQLANCFIVEQVKKPEFKELWIEQKLDNFNESDSRTWKMRYYANDKFYQPGGPIFIEVGGEWLMRNKEMSEGHFYDIAKKTGAYLFGTEHRYYGYSRPTANMSVDNLKYLNLKQANADLSHFIKHQKATVPGLSNSKVILKGCSYAGTMVTWFKREYPQEVDGVWALSAPLYYRLDFSDFIVNIGRSIRLAGGDACYERIESVSKTFQKLNDIQSIGQHKESGWIEHLNDIAEQIGSIVQKGNGSQIKKFCQEVLVEENEIVSIHKALQKYGKKDREVELIDEIQNLTFKADKMNRQWMYQICNEFGNFQSTTSEHQPFGQTIPFTDLVKECKDLFGSKYSLDYVNENIEKTNEYFGGYKPNVENVYFSQGELDPWRTAGIYDENRATTLPGLSHCPDTNSISDVDSNEVRAAKEKVIDLIIKWIR